MRYKLPIRLHEDSALKSHLNNNNKLPGMGLSQLGEKETAGVKSLRAFRLLLSNSEGTGFEFYKRSANTRFV
jgi:hypothetical protein